MYDKSSQFFILVSILLKLSIYTTRKQEDGYKYRILVHGFRYIDVDSINKSEERCAWYKMLF